MGSTGIRELKDHLSGFVARAAAGERVLITDRGRVVAALVPAPTSALGSRYDALVATGEIQPALATGDPLAAMPRVKLPKGLAAALLDLDRGER